MILAVHQPRPIGREGIGKLIVWTVGEAFDLSRAVRRLLGVYVSEPSLELGRFPTMPLTPGTTLGSYSVTAKIGEGGMGEVYRVRDTKLDRDVALMLLPQTARLASAKRTLRRRHPRLRLFQRAEHDISHALNTGLVPSATL